MRLVRYNPFNELDFPGNSFHSLFNDSFLNPTFDTEKSWYPAVDILNEKDEVILNVELPGMNKDDISVDIKDRILTIKGEKKFEHEEKKDHYLRKERSYGSFKRAFSLSDDVLTDDVTADFKDGILKVTLKKDTESKAVKQISIQ